MLDHVASAGVRFRRPRPRSAVRLALGQHWAHGVPRGAVDDGAGGGVLLHQRSPQRGRHGGRAFPRRNWPCAALAARAARGRRPAYRPVVPVWHCYEEVEHKAVLFDVFHAARGHGLYTYAVRIDGLWIAVVLLVIALPSVSRSILRARASRRACTRGAASSVSSSGAAGCCGIDGRPSRLTIGATSTRGGTSTTGVSCRTSMTRSSIRHRKIDRRWTIARGPNRRRSGWLRRRGRRSGYTRR